MCGLVITVCEETQTQGRTQGHRHLCWPASPASCPDGHRPQACHLRIAPSDIYVYQAHVSKDTNRHSPDCAGRSGRPPVPTGIARRPATSRIALSGNYIPSRVEFFKSLIDSHNAGRHGSGIRSISSPLRSVIRKFPAFS